MADKLLLIDGNSIINRAFFGLGPNARLTAPDGRPTGAVLTFFNILLKYLKAEEPTHVIAAFDRPEPTFRHKDFDGYKATRTGMPEELAQQMPILKSCLEALGIEQIELAGYEADDLIGTFAKLGEEAGMYVQILTGDKDSFQLIRDRIHVIMPGAKAILGDKLYDREAFEERYGVKPEEFIDVKAIMGDSSDNIPGVKGIGEKGALSLISDYKNLDTVYEHLDELKPGHRNKLIEHKEMAYLSQQLATIKCDVPVDLVLEKARLPEQFGPEALQIFRTFGFNSLIDRLNLTQVTHDESTSVNESKDGKTASFHFDLLNQTFSWPIDVSVSRSDFSTILNLVAALSKGSIVSIAVYQKENKAGEQATVLAYLKSDDELMLEPYLNADDLQQLVDLVRENELVLLGYDLKRWLRQSKVSMNMEIFDIMSASYLLSLQEQYTEEVALHSALSGGQADSLSFTGLLVGAADAEQEQASGSVIQTLDMIDADVDEDEEPASIDILQNETEAVALRSAFWSYVLVEPLKAALKERNLDALARDCDMPLVLCLAKIEHKGFLVDVSVLEVLNEEFNLKIDELESQIYELAGKEFSINSPKQLGDVLFVDLGLPSGRKGKTGNYSTAQAELDRLRPMHKIIDKITDYRQLTKLRSTFIEGLTKYVDPKDGRIHSHFNANFTNTGRLSSKDPNLQNIPIRQEVGREIRKAFVAADGYVLLDADYSQIELRLLAELSGDEAMIDAYQSNVDIHSLTATRIFHVPLDAVTNDLRSRAKTINFSIVYGISDFGLSQRLDLSVSEAHQYIENYYAGYPAVKPFMEKQIEIAKERGYSETLLGRRRYIPELSSKNRNLRQFGERAAMNSPVQGTAADIIRVAMVNCAKRLEEEGLDAELVSQVHDELIIEVSESDQAKAAVILRESMEGAITLSVPMEAEVSSGQTWFDAK